MQPQRKEWLWQTLVFALLVICCHGRTSLHVESGQVINPMLKRAVEELLFHFVSNQLPSTMYFECISQAGELGGGVLEMGPVDG
jgi:hypothetical protein